MGHIRTQMTGSCAALLPSARLLPAWLSAKKQWAPLWRSWCRWPT